MLVFNNYFCKNRKSKLHFGDHVAVLNVFLYQTGGVYKQERFTCAVKLRGNKIVERQAQILEHGVAHKRPTQKLSVELVRPVFDM
jgi:hypothetical protein